MAIITDDDLTGGVTGKASHPRCQLRARVEAIDCRLGPLLGDRIRESVVDGRGSSLLRCAKA